ncbi:MAG: type II toxin-antitoxin system Phd/YefM family antitoxin [Clostridiales bacterium]|nr:type II toxin-antitoxin system Phd/YefM family antitoxin [Clostridiales bacterium]
MTITVSEFRSHIGKYSALAATEDVFITRRGKIVAKLCSATDEPTKDVESLFGILPQTTTLEEAMECRMDQV